MQDYHKLDVWKRAHALAIEVRRMAEEFRPGFADQRDQITRAAESIVFNLVEGCGAATQREFARFLDISIKSTTEVEDGLELASDHQLIRGEKWDKLSAEVVEIRKMLHGLRKKVLAKDELMRQRRRSERRRRGATD